jgi:hypothetical protein
MTFLRPPGSARAVLAEFPRKKGDAMEFLDYDWRLMGGRGPEERLGPR